MNEYDGIVYDLDGTLVELAVDWEQARSDTVARLESHGIEAGGATLWELLERGQANGFEDRIEDVLSGHEQEGARRSTRLEAAERLPQPVPTGVCTLNCEAAGRLALETHELDDHIDTIVGRDTVATTKPDPEPLLETVNRLSLSPARTLFVGDSERDEVTAKRAGTAFMYVDQYLGSEPGDND